MVRVGTPKSPRQFHGFRWNLSGLPTVAARLPLQAIHTLLLVAFQVALERRNGNVITLLGIGQKRRLFARLQFTVRKCINHGVPTQGGATLVFLGHSDHLRDQLSTPGRTVIFRLLWPEAFAILGSGS